jgi:hypothetical protein
VHGRQDEDNVDLEHLDDLPEELGRWLEGRVDHDPAADASMNVVCNVRCLLVNPSGMVWYDIAGSSLTRHGAVGHSTQWRRARRLSRGRSGPDDAVLAPSGVTPWDLERVSCRAPRAPGPHPGFGITGGDSGKCPPSWAAVSPAMGSSRADGPYDRG